MAAQRSPGADSNHKGTAMKHRHITPPDAPNVSLPGDPKVNVNARLFAAVAMFMATRDIRYYLNGVYVEAGPVNGAVMCATDGHQMALAYDPEGVAPKDGHILPVHRQAVAAARSRKAGRVAIVGDRLRVFDTMLTELFIQPGVPLVEGKFPQWDRVVPTSANLLPQASGTWNSDLLGRIAAAAKFMARKHGLGVTHWQESPKPGEVANDRGAMLTRFDVEPNFVVLTMSMRGTPTSALPEFVRPFIAAKVEARAAKAASAASTTTESAVPA